MRLYPSRPISWTLLGSFFMHLSIGVLLGFLIPRVRSDNGAFANARLQASLLDVELEAHPLTRSLNSVPPAIRPAFRPRLDSVFAKPRSRYLPHTERSSPISDEITPRVTTPLASGEIAAETPDQMDRTSMLLPSWIHGSAPLRSIEDSSTEMPSAALAGADHSRSASSPTTWPTIRQEYKTEYPPQARELGIEGTVVLRVLVDERGLAKKVVIRAGPGYGLNEAAALALPKFSFTPARTALGRPLAQWITYHYEFRLRD